jgi:hypothetical protein
VSSESGGDVGRVVIVFSVLETGGRQTRTLANLALAFHIFGIGEAVQQSITILAL